MKAKDSSLPRHYSYTLYKQVPTNVSIEAYLILKSPHCPQKAESWQDIIFSFLGSSFFLMAIVDSRAENGIHGCDVEITLV